MDKESRNQTKINFQEGFSVLEILLAITITLIALTAVMLVSFGNQSLSIDSQTAGEAQHKAQELLEMEEANARSDFRTVKHLPAPPATFISDGIYKKTVNVSA